MWGSVCVCVCVYKNMYFYILIIMRLKIQSGVNSCGASKPVYKHVCDSNHLFLSLALSPFPICLCVWHSCCWERAAPSFTSSKSLCLLCSFLPSALHHPHILLCPSDTPSPLIFRVLIKQWDGCHYSLTIVQHAGMPPTPCSTVALNLVGCFLWLRLNGTFGLAGQEILITFLKVIL